MLFVYFFLGCFRVCLSLKVFPGNPLRWKNLSPSPLIWVSGTLYSACSPPRGLSCQWCSPRFVTVHDKFDRVAFWESPTFSKTKCCLNHTSARMSPTLNTVLVDNATLQGYLRRRLISVQSTTDACSLRIPFAPFIRSPRIVTTQRTEQSIKVSRCWEVHVLTLSRNLMIMMMMMMSRKTRRMMTRMRRSCCSSCNRARDVVSKW